MPSQKNSAKQPSRHAARQLGTQGAQARLRRIQSMAGPLPGDARALGPAAVLARSWKAAAFRETPEPKDIDGPVARDEWVEFGISFLTYAVLARQHFVRIIDGLGLGRRDAARVMSLIYATDKHTHPEDAGEWLEYSAARLLFPASGLHAPEDDGSVNPASEAIVQGLFKAAGQPGLHARFLREFKALADNVYWSEGEIAFIDSAAVDAENGENAPSLFLPPRLRSRFLFAVLKDTGQPLGLAEIRNPELPLWVTEAKLEDMWQRNLGRIGGWAGHAMHDGEDDEDDGSGDAGEAESAPALAQAEPAEDAEAAAPAPDAPDAPEDGQEDGEEDEEEDGEDGWDDELASDFDTGRLGEAFELFAEAGIAPQSCLLGGRLLADPSLDRFYDGQGRLALPYVSMVRASDPILQEAVEAVDMEELLASGERLPHEGGLIFTSTRPVEVGTDARPAWLHVGWCYLPPDEEYDNEDDECGEEQEAGSCADQDACGQARPAGTGPSPEALRNWRQAWRLGLVTGACMTGPEAFTEYYALQKAAEICDSAPVRRRTPWGTTAVLRRGHNLFSAIGLAAWGLLADSMKSFWDADLDRLVHRLEHLRACTLRPRWITTRSIVEDEAIGEAFKAAGIACPHTVFLDGRHLRYDPLRDFADVLTADDVYDETGEFEAYLKELTPDRLDAELMVRPFWPRRHRPWRIGKGRRHPRPRRTR